MVNALLASLLRLTPVGAASIIVAKILEAENLVDLMSSLGMLIATVALGTAVYQAIIMPLLFFVFTRRNPLTFWKGLLQAELTVIATDSS